MLLIDPYPVPVIHTVSVPVQQKYGITVKDDGDVRVFLKNILPSSIFQNTLLKIGQRLLMVNGVPVINAQEAVKLMKESRSSATLDLKVANVDKPFTKFVVAPLWNFTPGVAFRSVRANSLVQVDRIYTKGPFSGRNLRPGDIILSVNGKPVRSPDDAFKLLQEAAKTSNHVILYAIDMNELRGSTIEQVQDSMYKEQIEAQKPTNAARIFQRKNDSINPKTIRLVYNKPNSFSVLVGSTVEIEHCEFGADDLLLHDPRPFERMHVRVASLGTGVEKLYPLRYNKHYKDLQNFIANINESLDQDLDLLSQAVSVSVWQESLQRISSAVIASAPLEDDIPLAQATLAPLGVFEM